MAETRPKGARPADVHVPGATRTARTIVAALAVVVVGFVSATWYSHEQAAQIRALVAEIADNATPSIVHLTTARGALRQIEALLTLYVEGLGPGADAIDQARADFEREVHDYLRLPVFPGERELWADVNADVDRVDRDAARALELMRAGDRRRAQSIVAGELVGDVDRASDSIERSIALNASFTQERARAIEGVRRATGLVAFGLDGLCALLALSVGFVAYRTVRGSMALAEQRRRELERSNDELETFALRVAHDILGPLTPVVMALDVARQRAESDDRARATFDAALRSVSRVRTMVDGLLTFARAGAEPDPGARADVGAVVAGVIEDARPLAAEMRIELAPEIEELPDAACSPAVLTSIVSNLVRNAIKYMGDSEVRKIRVRALGERDRVRIEVIDTGPGLPRELGDRIFEPYVRPRESHAPGIGLGLATVKRLVVAHGGIVGFDAAGRRGTRFWVELPVAR